MELFYLFLIHFHYKLICRFSCYVDVIGKLEISKISFIYFFNYKNFFLNKSYAFAASLPPKIKIISLFVKKAFLSAIL